MNNSVVTEAARIEEDALYSSKGQFEAARIWSFVHFSLGIPSAVLAGFSSATAFSDRPIVAGTLALVATVLVSISTFLNPSDRENCHKIAGTRFAALRNRVRVFYEIEINSIGESEAIMQLKKLVDEKDELNNSSPQIPRIAFVRARKGIEDGEASYKVDK